MPDMFLTNVLGRTSYAEFDDIEVFLILDLHDWCLGLYFRNKPAWPQQTKHPPVCIYWCFTI